MSKKNTRLALQDDDTSFIEDIVAKYKKNRTRLITAVIILAVAVVVAGAILTYSKIVIKKGGGMTPQSIKDIAELSTIEFRFKDVIVIDEEEEFKLFGLWDIDPGESILIVQYNGIIKLGIDCADLRINIRAAEAEGEKNVIEIKLPPVKVLSYEMGDWETILEKGFFTKATVSVTTYNKILAEHQAQYKADALNQLNESARNNAMKQLEKIILFAPEIHDAYTIQWFD